MTPRKLLVLVGQTEYSLCELRMVFRLRGYYVLGTTSVDEAVLFTVDRHPDVVVTERCDAGAVEDLREAAKYTGDIAVVAYSANEALLMTSQADIVVAQAQFGRSSAREALMERVRAAAVRKRGRKKYPANARDYSQFMERASA